MLYPGNGGANRTKGRTVLCVLVMIFAIAHGETGHGDEGHGRQEELSAGGHASALGRHGRPDDVTRSIEVEMNDTMRFRPERIVVRRGETVRFIVHNTGKLRHEMVLGTMEELKEHAGHMEKVPGMKHVDPNQVSVEPGKTGELIWQFTREGTFDFACFEPGHFEAGMTGEIVVGHETE